MQLQRFSRYHTRKQQYMLKTKTVFQYYASHITPNNTPELFAVGRPNLEVLLQIHLPLYIYTPIQVL